MTALDKYARLEAMGLWRADPDAQRRDVIVSFGDATLVLTDQADRPLTHWSLPAIERRNPGQVPAIFGLAGDASEELEVSDDDLIAALETVQTTLKRRGPRPGRLRLWSGLAIFAAILAICVLWLPGALVRQTLTVVPPTSRAAIGEGILAELMVLTGPQCRSQGGQAALDALAQRTLGTGTDARIAILPANQPEPTLLPGGIVVLNRTVVEDYEDPTVTAGFILATARQTTEVGDPLDPVLRRAGLRQTLALLTTGTLPDAAIKAEARARMSAQSPWPDQEALLFMFEEAQLPSTPFAYALDVSGESTLPLIEADPMAGRSLRPLIPDDSWVRLQGICGS